MILSKLSVSDFRNLEKVEATFEPNVNVFYGSNGSGKTNLMEAIFVLCLGRSQRGAADQVLLRQGAEVYRLEGRVTVDHMEHEVAVAYARSARRKLTIDRAVVRPAELYERFCVVAAGPEDSEVLSGSPSARRTFMDVYLSQLSRNYLQYLIDYQKALQQKNAALKQEMDPAPFEPLVISLGSKLMHLRAEFVRELASDAGAQYLRISDGEPFGVEYRPSVRLDSEHATLEEIETAFQVKLEDNFDRERILRTAIVGPHRDDIEFSVGGLPARTHGSQGQWRTAAVSLKLAVFNMLKQKRKQKPILLLDEIFAELDGTRSDGLIESFGDFGQLFLTTAAAPPEKLRGLGRSYRLAGGRLEEAH